MRIYWVALGDLHSKKYELLLYKLGYLSKSRLRTSYQRQKPGFIVIAEN